MRRFGAAGACAAAFLVAPGALGLDNGLAQTPPMGYSTWNDYGCDGGVTADNIKGIADALVDLGLDKLGYRYVNVDDCWAHARDPDTQELVPDKEAFPQGMKDVGDYIHGKGLKFGLYTDRGKFTCGTRPGTLGHEKLDAQTFASWGVDYLKEDSCNVPNDNPDTAINQFALMRDALNATGRPVHFSMCGWKPWYAPVGRPLANSWRISMDVSTWETVWYAAVANEALAAFAGPGGWNDPDALLGSTRGARMTFGPEQVQTQFSLWAMMASPLIISTRMLRLSDHDLQVYSNEEVIAVDQDPAGHQGRVIWENCPKRDASKLLLDIKQGRYPEVPACRQIWARALKDGDAALLLINWARDANWDWVRVDEALMRQLGFPQGALVRDLYAKQDVGVHKRFEVLIKADSASKMYRLTNPSTPSLFA